jgi:hypothetical protein
VSYIIDEDGNPRAFSPNDALQSAKDALAAALARSQRLESAIVDYLAVTDTRKRVAARHRLAAAIDPSNADHYTQDPPLHTR